MSFEGRPAGSPSDALGHTEFVLKLPSDLGIIEAAVGYLVSRCRACAFEGSRLELNFRVGVTEALANAILYGNRGDPDKTVRVEVSLDPGAVQVCVIDEGEGFDTTYVPDPRSPENLELPGGRGLFLIRELMDEAEFNERGNSVRMLLVRASGSASQADDTA